MKLGEIMAIYLIIKENDQEERVRLTARPFLIGRSSKCHKTLTDSMVSGRHLAVKINDDHRVVIKDLETTNGTYLNGSKISESFLYLDDFIQVGKVTMELDDSEMSAKELGLHKRDYERTNVTFVKMGAQIDGVDDMEEDEFGQLKQKNLLAKIRQKKSQEGSDEEEQTMATKIDENQKDLLQEASLKIKQEKKKKKVKKPQKKASKENDDDDGLVDKLKGFFKK